MTCMTSTPKCATMRSAITGPMPLISPEPRYFWMPAAGSGPTAVISSDPPGSGAIRAIVYLVSDPTRGGSPGPARQFSNTRKDNKMKPI